MRVLIVDDEALARERLKRMLAEIGAPYQLASEAANGQEAIDTCQCNEIDLVLMDISMPGMDGLTAAAVLAEGEMPPAIIFTTAYDEHALAAFERNATDYLLKPIRRERLQQALERAQRPTRAQLDPKSTARTHICAHLGREIRTIPLQEIIYFQAEQKYVTTYFNSGEAILEEPLKKLEEEFSALFLRIHRNALVAKSRITGMKQDSKGRWRVTLQNLATELEVSRRHLAQLRHWLKER
ncbi:MAG: LytTR family DNA-binding domain-containing protein [Candidatus Polarisedimenticolaceae bacterium]|nr:LytTR family DNA-binding domain-containing protein [Candidatus Polarisedimenticolaceae bacterium]